MLQKYCFSIGWLLERCRRRPSDSGIAMGTPGTSAGALFLSSASAPSRKRAAGEAGEAGVARSRQRVLELSRETSSLIQAQKEYLEPEENRDLEHMRQIAIKFGSALGKVSQEPPPTLCYSSNL